MTANMGIVQTKWRREIKDGRNKKVKKIPQLKKKYSLLPVSNTWDVSQTQNSLAKGQARILRRNDSKTLQQVYAGMILLFFPKG